MLYGLRLKLFYCTHVLTRYLKIWSENGRFGIFSGKRGLVGSIVADDSELPAN